MMVAIENAEVKGITASGEVLVASGGASYRIEFKAGQIDLLRRLCEVYALNVDCSTQEDRRAALSREG